MRIKQWITAPAPRKSRWSEGARLTGTEGDVLVVWRLGRLGRSLTDLIELVWELEQRNVGFRILQESMDTLS